MQSAMSSPGFATAGKVQKQPAAAARAPAVQPVVAPRPAPRGVPSARAAARSRVRANTAAPEKEVEVLESSVDEEDSALAEK